MIIKFIGFGSMIIGIIGAVGMLIHNRKAVYKNLEKEIRNEK